MKDNLIKNNFEKIMNKKIINFNDFYNNTKEEFPFIPVVYFNENSDDKKPNNKIIDTYFDIKMYLNHLEIIKKFILSIIKVSFKDEFEKIILYKENLGLVKSNLMMDFKDKLSDTFFEKNYENENEKSYNKIISEKINKTRNLLTPNILKEKKIDYTIFKNFIDEFMKNEKYHLFKKIDLEINKPYFLKIFQTKYIGKNKNFILQILNKYIFIRKKLLECLNNNYGILSFSFMFEIKNNQDLIFLKKKNINNSKKNNNINNIDKFIFYGNENSNDNGNDNGNDNKKKLSIKINNFNLLYINNLDKENYKKIFNSNINKYYNEFKKSIDNTFDSSDQYNLYNVLINNLELDFNTLQFISYYVDPFLFRKSIDIHNIINNYIYEDLNYLDMNYDFYLEWYNKFMGKEKSSKKFDDNYEIKLFDTFFDTEIEKFIF